MMRFADGYERPLLVSWGAGVNSTALLVGLHERGIRPDLIQIADTRGEKPETYRYFYTFQAWLEAVGFPSLTVVTKRSMYESLEDNCVRKAMLPSLAYGFSSCSEKWKHQPQERYVNNWQPAKDAWAAGRKVHKCLGIDAGEARRAKIDEDEKYRYWYPLIEWDWAREECLDAIERAGLPAPIKSACFFCPASTKNEIRWLAQTHPDLLQRALAMEDAAAPNLRSVRGLGRRWSWREFLESEGAAAALPDPPQLGCLCFDGADE
jgi:hypothetical protein